MLILAFTVSTSARNRRMEASNFRRCGTFVDIFIIADLNCLCPPNSGTVKTFPYFQYFLLLRRRQTICTRTMIVIFGFLPPKSVADLGMKAFKQPQGFRCQDAQTVSRPEFFTINFIHNVKFSDATERRGIKKRGPLLCAPGSGIPDDESEYPRRSVSTALTSSILLVFQTPD